MSKTWRLKAFLAALCVSAVAIDSAAGQNATAPVEQTTEPAAASPAPADDAMKPGWLLGRQNRVVNPFRATPAPGTARALQNQGRDGSLPVAPGLPRVRAAVKPAPPGTLANPAARGALSAQGCTIGFRRMGTTCVAVEIPENATLDLTGHNWTCKQGFYRQERSCVAVAVPANASLDATGRRWACNYGFRRQEQGCVAVLVPEHASLDKLGRNWVCNQGYERRDEGCIDDATARLQNQANKAGAPRPATAQTAIPRSPVTVNSGESRQGRTSKAKVVIGRF
jgi:hypothetical protein